MSSVFDTSWFYWAVGVAIGLPIVLVVLTELQHALTRRGSYLARPVHVFRITLCRWVRCSSSWVKGAQVPAEATPVRIVATVFGFVVLILLLSGLNATLFQGAPEGSWRKRIPTMFLDVARFALIAIGVGLMFSFIWGADVGRLFTALGITSIVLGLALQNSVGQIISGLFVLFEQPFRLGDWIDTPSARGRVAEVNWRATHIDTGTGLLIMPNSVLAAASFTNLSRPAGAHTITVTTVFSLADPPDDVCAMLSRVAGALPHLRPDAVPSSSPAGGTGYRTSIPLHSPADDLAARSTFLRWIWYAARRVGLHLDEADDDFATDERVEESLRVVAPTLRLTQADQDQLLPHVRITRYGADGALIPIRTLDEGAFIGQTTLTREPVAASAYALGEVSVLQIDREHIEELVARKPLLLQDIGRAIEERRANVRQALAVAQN